MWIALFFLCEQVGVALGIAVESVVNKMMIHWKYSFMVQSTLLIAMVVIPMMCVPGEYFKQGESLEGDDNEGKDEVVKGGSKREASHGE
jgi:hypothetical protein